LLKQFLPTLFSLPAGELSDDEDDDDADKGQSHPGQLSPAIPQWVGVMSTGDGFQSQT